ncbi:MAG: hypothetical protein IT176_01685 [Acidobacteria bacterium]|nr:hypothetical protein [Acidobacteriota bacterium]
MMNRFPAVCALAVLALAGAVAACGRKSPVAPSEAGAAAGAASPLTASVGAPRPLAPAAGAQIRNADQPVTLIATNGFSTKPGAVYTFEVATDAAFATKVQTKENVQESGSGKTSVQLGALAAARDYYWHVRSTAGGTTGVFSQTFKFTIGPAVSLGAPSPIAPLNGSQTGARPTLRVGNVSRSGPAGALTYVFEVATSSAFTTVVASATVPEGAAETGFELPADLPANTTFFWRAAASDASSGVAGPPSAAQSFTTSLAIDLARVVYLRGPNLSTWKQTGRIIAIDQDGSAAANGYMCISFTDPGWPGAKWIYGGDDPNFEIFANQWYFANINGIWYAGAGEWLYRGGGTCKAGQGTRTIGPDSGFGEPFTSWVPRVGELVGYAVTASARALPQMATVQERTDVVLYPWHDTSIQPFHGQTVIEFAR